MSELQQAISEMRNMRESYDQLAALAEQANKKGFAQLTIEGLNQQVTLNIVPANTTPLSLMQRGGNIIEIDDDSMVNLTDISIGGYGSCKKVTVRKCLYLNAAYYRTSISTSLREFYAPEAVDAANSDRLFFNCIQLRVLYVPKLEKAHPEFIAITPKLIDITIGKDLYMSYNSTDALFKWEPTEALASDSQSLLTPEDITAGFTSNREKLLYNIREHIAANLQDRTGKAAYTMKMSAAVKAAILADQETADAFTNKNWIVA